MSIRQVVSEATIKRGQLLGKAGRWQDALEVFKSVAESSAGKNARANYLLGNAYFQQKDLSNALVWTELAVGHDGTNQRWYIRLGSIYEQMKRHAEASSAYAKAVSMEPNNVEWLGRLARALENSKQFEDAKSVLASAVKLDPNNSDLHSRYVNVSLKKGPTWQKVDSLEGALTREPLNYHWLEKLGQQYEALGQFDSSSKKFHEAILAGSSAPSTLIELEYTAKKAGNAELQHFARTRISEIKPSGDLVDLQIAKYFQKQGDWPTAYSYYKTACEEKRLEGESFYNAGLAADRSHLWEEASEFLRAAVTRSPERSKWHYRLGLSLERQNRFDDAANAYSAAIRFDPKPQTYWYYRLGICFAHLGQVETACEAFKLSGIKLNDLVEGIETTEQAEIASYDLALYTENLELLLENNDSQGLHDRGLDLLKRGYYPLASQYLNAACMRSNDQPETWYFQLGLVEWKLGSYPAAVEAFKQSRVLGSPHGISPDQYLKVKWRREQMEYVDFQDNLPLQENAILYESYFGSQIACNPRAIYSEMLSISKYQDFIHYWVVSDDTLIPEDIRGRKNVIFVHRGSRLYRRLLATAKYLINNVTFPNYYVRREGQFYLNTWHGTPLKTLGRDIQTGFMEHANVTRNFLQATHLLAPNDHTESVLIKRYDIDGLFNGKIVRSGSPRVDEVMRMSPQRRTQILSELGIENDKDVVFYAPTWRGSLNTKHFDVESLCKDLEALSSNPNVEVIFRAHHMTERLLKGVDLGVHIAPSSVSSNELLSISDVLVTDYSSIFFDYLPLNKPIVYHVPDLEEYTAERGLYFQMEQLPGYVSKSTDELIRSIQRALAEGLANPAQHAAAMDEFAPYETGDASRKTIEAFFGESNEYSIKLDNQKINLLFHQSLLPNGITSAFINLINKIDERKYRVVFLFDPKPFASEPERMERFSRLPAHVQLVPRIGSQLVSLEERWVIDKFNAWNNWGSKEQETIYRQGFSREFRRIFGEASFSAAIEFDGYAPFWSALMACSQEQFGKSIAYMHNRIFKEWSTKYPELAATMRISRWYDSLLSVSEATNEINRSELSELFQIDERRFLATNNIVSKDEILEMSTEPLDNDIERFLSGASEIWVTIGRMSPEKGHLKLFEAFNEHILQKPGAKLVLLGDGPLRYDLEAYIRDHGLSESIYLAGQRNNPFAILKTADAFVLASDHEGQPMVLLEALTLGKKVLATDIVGNRGVLGPGYGHLVENSVTGLRIGFETCMSNPPKVEFDVDKYCEDALQEFLHSVAS